MTIATKDVFSNKDLVSKMEKNLGKTILSLMQVPANETEAKLITALGLKEGDIIASLDIGGIHDHSWSCGASLPPDCSIDADG
jgi:hypothetical protein